MALSFKDMVVIVLPFQDFVFTMAKRRIPAPNLFITSFYNNSACKSFLLFQEVYPVS